METLFPKKAGLLFAIGSSEITREKKIIKWGFYKRSFTVVLTLKFTLKEISVQRYYDKRIQKTFSVLPFGLFPYTRITLDYIKTILELRLFFRSTLRKLNGKPGEKICSVSTVWNYLNKLGKKSEKELRRIKYKFSGVLCIDEIWVKIKKKWHYLFLAIDGKTSVILLAEVYKSKEKKYVRKFLRRVKKLVDPTLVISDRLSSYVDEIPKFFPEAKHQWCLYHLMDNIYTAFKKTYGKDEEMPGQIRRLRDVLINAFKSPNKESAYAKLKLITKYLIDRVSDEAYNIVAVIKTNIEEILTYFDTEIKTNNAIEHVNAFFKPYYKLFKCFSSLEGARNFSKLFAFYFNFAKFERGMYAGKSPYEIADAQLSGDWLFYLLN